MPNKIILGFVGPIASGKGTACEYLNKEYQATTHRFSTMLRDVLNRLYIPQTRENLQAVSLVLRQQFGDDMLAKVISQDVANDPSEMIAIDGIRRLPDIAFLKELPGFYLVYINADQKIRYERITKRDENTDDTQKTFEQFQQDEQREAEKHIAEVGQQANIQINNDGNLDDLHKQIDKIIEDIKNQK
jgi:dephospho-CoA kinase